MEGEEYSAPAVTFVRVHTELNRTIRNTGAEPVRLLIASAPRTSGYTPLEWA